ncbi:MAG: hypothetical protein AMQ74_01932 [Candidatus Methanofastidiosum methylothiophilum]|uniref:Uncharacterized protein n=1 Tax=Candidatus Methanofastidiosum methylothiophilum TaxID=1705564 RepID=A0A150IIE3_9EURY|nr:MAG: hypothetical protein AMQ74_01932 [Candidatus Methanofastidiosum methylthiophilus]
MDIEILSAKEVQEIYKSSVNSEVALERVTLLVNIKKDIEVKKRKIRGN